MQRRSKAVPAETSEPEFSLEACRQCLASINADLPAITASAAIGKAPDDAAAAAMTRLSRSFSQLNWMMSPVGTKRQLQLKADLRAVEKEMLDSGLVSSLVDLLMTLLVNFNGAGDELAVRVLLRLLNSTDQSLEFCFGFVGQEKFFRVYFPQLLNAQDGGRMLELTTASLVECAVGIAYNMYFKNDSALYRRLAEYPDLVDSAKPYLASPVTRVSATALIFIAFAVDETRAEIFLGAKKSINYLISILRLGLKAPERACDGYSVAEMAKCINRLALNDANKDLLMDLNVLSVLKLMLDSAESQDVQEGLKILFTLSFSPRGAERIRTEFRGHIDRLEGSEQWRSSRQLRGLVFRLDGERVESHKPAPRSRRIMLSYNHTSRRLVERLHSRLCESHLDVWVDFRHLKEGSTLDAMSEAVENSQVVLLCISRLYKESNNCRLEAEYAWKCGKKLIPVLVEPKYRATGWLGMLLGTQLYFDLTETKYPFEEKFSQLLPAILTSLESAMSESPGQGEQHHQQHRIPTPAPLLPPIAAGAAPAAPSTVPADVRAWDADRVSNWCLERGLPQQVADMRLSGRELHFLLGAMARSPEFFGRLLERYFCFDRLHDMAALVSALEDLAGPDRHA